jgi:nitrite reductase (NADH) large subunit
MRLANLRMMRTTLRLVVVGNGMVGQRFLESLPAEAGFDIAVLAEEPRGAYDRVQLSTFFSGKSAQDLALAPAGFFARAGIELRLGEGALAIDRTRRLVRCAAGELPYDRLVLATGSAPFVPPIAGRERAGCHVYRTIEDLEAIKQSAHGARSGVVIGGGLLGLEAAKALKDLGLTTHVVEFAPRLMAVQIDEVGAAVLRRSIAALGVSAHTGKNTREIVAGREARHLLRFADGDTLEADVVVFSAGIRPRDELARACGLAVGERGGVIIDDACRTSDPDIYAIGECARWRGQLFGLVAPGYQMAQVAARQLCGEVAAAFTGADLSTKLKLLGVEVASVGDAHASTPGARSYAYTDEPAGIYKKLVVDASGERLLGAILIGDASQYGSCLQMTRHTLKLPAHPEQLILPASGEAQSPAGEGIAALPASAQICSCNDVSKEVICTAVEQGCTTLAAIKNRTRAATSCGGCAPLVAQLLRAELKRRGTALENHVCEHFRFSRQQLFHLIRFEELRSFGAVLARHGRGRGCDVCKPLIASILASCWNEFVLSERASLQDTNDYFLANIQKDGTYSVIPRIPGGEITAEKLIVLGEVARRYGLYTKITGGQRIDLLGARVHQLPHIWRDLIAAGFESGHAYGKAMRTVKSCVGSTWCRYGVQDSVALAIRLENRYKGLRSPHKIKLAVSGCTRECAEAQGKDVGVIATEKGWNLYVCGNGGMKPRHAELLARDVDELTLVRYIDRFLMFYIRTADRLQRTATWRDGLEGGLEYLQAVICADSLGIGAELEADMRRIVDSYECEWKHAIEDPATLNRFRHFVNDATPDDNVVFVRERGQIRPATRAEKHAAPAQAP